MDDYLALIGTAPFGRFRRQLICRLVRSRTLEQARLLGKYAVLIDATGYLTFRQRHCEHCLTRKGERRRCGVTSRDC
jgi:hypothetical protein